MQSARSISHTHFLTVTVTVTVTVNVTVNVTVTRCAFWLAGYPFDVAKSQAQCRATVHTHTHARTHRRTHAHARTCTERPETQGRDLHGARRLVDESPQLDAIEVTQGAIEATCTAHGAVDESPHAGARRATPTIGSHGCWKARG